MFIHFTAGKDDASDPKYDQWRILNLDAVRSIRLKQKEGRWSILLMFFNETMEIVFNDKNYAVDAWNKLHGVLRAMHVSRFAHPNGVHDIIYKDIEL